MNAAIDAGKSGSASVLANALRHDPNFVAKATEAIIRHLRACPKGCSNEDLVDVARAHGAIPHDDRAFGNIFRSLQSRGVIHTIGFGMRRKGRGAYGARIWALVQG
jgi:hypothetical protein